MCRIGEPSAGFSRLRLAAMMSRASAWALSAERQVDGHLVAVEVGVEALTDQRVQLDGAAFDEYRLEGLDAQAVQ